MPSVLQEIRASIVNNKEEMKNSFFFYDDELDDYVSDEETVQKELSNHDEYLDHFAPLIHLIYARRRRASLNFWQVFYKVCQYHLESNDYRGGIAYPNKDFTRVIMHPNLTGPYVKTRVPTDSFRNVVIPTEANIALVPHCKMAYTIYKTVVDDMEKARECMSHEAFVKSVKKKLKRRTSISMVQYVKKFCPHASAHELRDLAQVIEFELKPAELKFATKDTIAHYYQGGCARTCMTLESEYSKTWSERYRRYDFHPGMFYVLNPYADAVYIEDNKGRVIARTQVFKDPKEPDGKYVAYGRLYTANREGGNKLLQSLQVLNPDIKEYGQLHRNTFFNYTFRTKGISHPKYNDGKPVFPIPYIDVHDNHVRLAWDEENGEFVYGEQNKIQALGLPSRQVNIKQWHCLWDVQDLVAPKECTVCCNVPANISCVSNDAIFCSYRCVQSAGYVWVTDHEGNRQVMHPENVRMNEDGIWSHAITFNAYGENSAQHAGAVGSVGFTTLHAAKLHNFLPFITMENTKIDGRVTSDPGNGRVPMYEDRKYTGKVVITPALRETLLMLKKYDDLIYDPDTKTLTRSE